MNVLNTSTEGSTKPACSRGNHFTGRQRLASKGGQDRHRLSEPQSAMPDLIIASDCILVGMTGNASYPGAASGLGRYRCWRVASARRAASTPATAAPTPSPSAGSSARSSWFCCVCWRCMSSRPATAIRRSYASSPSLRLRKTRAARQPCCPAPANPRLVRGKLSRVTQRLLQQGRQRASSYQWRFATAGRTDDRRTLVDPTPGARIALDGLVAGTVYVVQVRAIGSLGPSDWSDVANLMVV